MSETKKGGVWRDFIGGGVGGLCAVVSGHPLDTIKVGIIDIFDTCSFFVNFPAILQVRLQTMPAPAPGQAPMFTGTWDCFAKTVKHEVKGNSVLFINLFLFIVIIF